MTQWQERSATSRVLLTLGGLLVPILLSITGYLLIQDRSAVASDIGALKARIEHQADQNAAFQQSVQALQIRQERIITDIREVRDESRASNDRLERKLDRVLRRFDNGGN